LEKRKQRCCQKANLTKLSKNFPRHSLKASSDEKEVTYTEAAMSTLIGAFETNINDIF